MNDPWLLETNDGPAGQPALSPLRVLAARKWLILLCILLTGGLGYLYYTKTIPIYESTAQVLLIDNTKRNPTDALEFSRGYEESLTDQALIMQSPLVISSAVEAADLGSLKTFQGSADTVSAVRKNLVVGAAQLYGHSAAQNALELSFQGPYPEECAAVVKAVVDSYQSFLGNTQRNISQETAALITEAKENLLAKLQSQESAYQEFLKQAPIYLVGGGSVNPHAEYVARLEAELSELAIQRARTISALGVLEQARTEGASRDALVLLARQALGTATQDNAEPLADEPEGHLQEMLDMLLIEEKVLLQKFGVEHPDIEAQRDRIAAVRELIQKKRAVVTRELPSGEELDQLDVFLQAIHQQLDSEEAREAELSRMLRQEQQNAKEFSVYLARAQAYRSEIARLQSLFDEVVKQLEDISLVQDYGGYETQVLTPPQIGHKVKPVLAIVMLASCIIGTAVGLGLAYALELADQNIRSADEIAGLLGTPVVGLIPVFTASKKLIADSDIGPAVVTHHRPKSRQAEAYRAIRTAMYFNARGRQHQVVQVTSPQAGDGKSTLAANLAVSIAQSGRRVLLIDADFRRPTVHKLFGLSNSEGSTSVLTGTAELADAVQSSGIDNLDILTCGPQPANPAELAISGELRDLLEVLKSKYEFVIVDSPPLLAVTDPSGIAARVDGVLLTMRLGKTTRGQLKQAYELLQSVEANVTGLVVNAVDPRHGGGYSYGNYRYHYGDRNGVYFDTESTLAVNGNGHTRALTQQ